MQPRIMRDPVQPIAPRTAHFARSRAKWLPRCTKSRVMRGFRPSWKSTTWENAATGRTRTAHFLRSDAAPAGNAPDRAKCAVCGKQGLMSGTAYQYGAPVRGASMAHQYGAPVRHTSTTHQYDTPVRGTSTAYLVPRVARRRFGPRVRIAGVHDRGADGLIGARYTFRVAGLRHARAPRCGNTLPPGASARQGA